MFGFENFDNMNWFEKKIEPRHNLKHNLHIHVRPWLETEVVTEL